jgi:hypothetical protein
MTAGTEAAPDKVTWYLPLSFFHWPWRVWVPDGAERAAVVGTFTCGTFLMSTWLSVMATNSVCAKAALIHFFTF